MRNRADDLRDLLEEEIVTGALPPGTRLDETQLATRFGVSRTPIREALLQLSAAGLIESGPRRGAFVAEIGPRRLVEMFDVMAELEAMCARLTARRASAGDLAAIRAAHARCRAAAAEADDDAYYYENEVFHELIRAASRNQFLTETANTLQKRLKPYRRLQLRARDRVRASFAEHDAVMAALEAGAPEAAAEAMRAHVSVQGEKFTDLLAQIEAETTLDRAGTGD